jgi:hypothetical protein
MTRCQGITLGGSRCKKNCKETHCWIHQKSDECGICLEPINKCIELECKHKFCESCINEWICVSKNYNCPTCRLAVSDKIKADAFNWGVKTFVLIQLTIVQINLSQFDLGFQELFMLYTDIEKDTIISVERVTEMRKEMLFLHEFKENWNIMFDKNNITARNDLYVNGSRKKLEKSSISFMFI